jgi:hypothetical protein
LLAGLAAAFFVGALAFRVVAGRSDASSAGFSAPDLVRRIEATSLSPVLSLVVML